MTSSVHSDPEKSSYDRQRRYNIPKLGKEKTHNVPSGKYETNKKKNYQIAISQDGKFVVTFDTANLWIKILENTDHRQLENDPSQSKTSDNINKAIVHFKINHDFFIEKFGDNCDNEASNTDVIDDNDGANFPSNDTMTIENKEIKKKNNNEFRWSLDISNVQKRKDKCFILVAVSHINVEKDMKKTIECDYESYERGYLEKKKCKCNPGEEKNKNAVINFENETNEMQQEPKHDKGIVIYYIRLVKETKTDKPTYALNVKRNVNIYYSYSVSGICKFVDVPDVDVDDNSKSEQKRFIILNFHGIYNFELVNGLNNFELSDLNHFELNNFDPFAPKGISFNLNEKFDYPKSFRHELNNWTKDDCMKRLRSCVYDKYFMVTQYKNDVQSLEVYNLAKMELETTAKRVENEEVFVKQSNNHTFSVSKLQFCFTQGINYILLYYMENGLQVASKKFDEIEEIYSLEFIDNDEKLFIIGKDSKENPKFIIWDLYNTGRIKPIMLNELYKGCSIEDLDAHLAITSGNILHVDDEGNVTSVIEKIENKLKESKIKANTDRKAKCIECGKNEHNNEHNNCNYNIYYDESEVLNDEDKRYIMLKFNKIAGEVEPWVLDDYKKSSYCLYYNKETKTKTEFIQLIVGRSTIQIWHQIHDDENRGKLPNKGEPFLEYVWANQIPVDQENGETLHVEGFNYGSNDKHKLKDFSLRVWWNTKKVPGEKIDKENKEITEETKKIKKVIKQKYIAEKFHAIRHACKALKHFNKRYINKRLVSDYNKAHKYEEIVIYIKHIVWRFAKYNSEQFKLLDVRHNFMKSLILGDCDHLIKFILFGDEESIDNENVSSKDDEKREEKKQKNSEIRHIPRNILWPGEKFIEGDDLDFIMKDVNLQVDEEPENNMELAIYHCKGRELKDTIMIAYFLEYYSGHATDCAGWMSTVSKAIPLLFKYNYDDYARKLFRKECFADHDHFSAQDPYEIIPEEYLTRRNHDIKFKAFRPIVELNSDFDKQKWWHDIIFRSFKSFKDSRNMIYKWIDNFDNDLGKSPLALRIIPLPGFTLNEIPSKKAEYNTSRIILNLLWFIFIPRWYQIGRKDRKKLSSFSRMVLYENNDDIYDNPAMEAVIDFRWPKARNFFLSFYSVSYFCLLFWNISWEYLNHDAKINGSVMIALIVIFYYLAIYQLVTEILQFFYRGTRKYFSEIFNIFDIVSIIFSMVIMSIMVKDFKFSNGFEGVETNDIRLMVGISFSVFFLWIELISYLRLLTRLGIYIYYFVIIFKTIFPFFLFMLIVIFAFGNTMYFLLKNPDNINTKDTTFSGNATNTLTNETLNIKLKSDFDPKSRTDNPFSYFSAAIIAAYFWIDSNWIQRDDFDFWAVDLFTFIISVILVIYLQNMLIAFMSDVFTEATTKGRQTLLRQRANLIADYEALHHVHLWKHDHEPKYIYYFGQSKNFEDWYDTKKDDRGAIYKGFEEKSTFTKRIFKERDYDKFSVWVFEEVENMKVYEKIEKIEKIKNMEKDIDDLIEDFKGQKNDKEIEYINNITKNININIKYLLEEFERKD